MNIQPSLIELLALNDQRLRNALQRSAIFCDLEPELIEELVNCMTTSMVHGGTHVFKQGDPADSLLVVVSGRLLICRQQPDKTLIRFSEIGSGHSVGEVGLILKQDRAADVIALRDTTVAKLDRAKFEDLLSRYPISLNKAIAKTIFGYSQQQTRPECNFGAKTIVVVPVSDEVELSHFCQQLKFSIEPLGRVALLQASDMPDARSHTQEKSNTNDTVHGDVLASHFFNDHEENYQYVIYQASGSNVHWTEMVLRQADQILLVAQSDTQPENALFKQSIFEQSHANLVRKSLVVLHPEDAITPRLDSAWHQSFELERIYPIRLQQKEDIERLGRFLTDQAVGLVLGGGGARGFAHIGVLRALEELNIPVDMICGNSMGALIGAQYAKGSSPEQILQDTQAFIRGGERPTLPLFSLLSGNRVKRDLKQLFAGLNIETLWRPFFCVSCNLSRAKLHIHEQGALWQAVLASNSPAGILPPVLAKGEFLVDAALLDNVPVEAMRKKLGFGTVIAIDVDVRNELNVETDLEELNGWQVLKQRLFQRKAKRLPGILDLLYHSGHIGGLAQAEVAKTMADYYLQPQLSRFALMAYHKSDDIAEQGYQYTIDYLRDWHS